MVRPPPGPLSKVVTLDFGYSARIVVRWVVVKSCVLVVSRRSSVAWHLLSYSIWVVPRSRVALGALVLKISVLYLVVVRTCIFVWVKVLVLV